MAGRYAEGTNVSVERTRAEIEHTLQRYGAGAFSYGWDGSRAVVIFQAHGRRVRLDLETPPLEAIDKARGDVPRNVWIRRACEQRLADPKASS